MSSISPIRRMRSHSRTERSWYRRRTAHIQDANVTAFDRWGLISRMLVGAAQRDLSIDLWASEFGNPTLNWGDLAWLRSLTKLPLLLKAIGHPDDARRAIDSGIDGMAMGSARSISQSVW